MTLQEQIMQDRAARGLKLTIRHPDGTLHTLYPATALKKAAWVQEAQRRGYQVVED